MSTIHYYLLFQTIQLLVGYMQNRCSVYEPIGHFCIMILNQDFKSYLPIAECFLEAGDLCGWENMDEILEKRAACRSVGSVL